MLVNGIVSSSAPAGGAAGADAGADEGACATTGGARARAGAGARGGRRGRGRGQPRAGAAAVDVGEHIGPGDASPLTRALDLAGLEVVLLQQLAYYRREHEIAVTVPGRLSRRRSFARGRRRFGGDCRGAFVGLGLGGWRLFLGRRRRRRARGRADHCEPGADVDGFPLGHEDLGQHARRRRRHLGVDLVGGDLEQDFILGHLITHLLEPLGDGALGDGLAQLRHRDVGHQPCSPLPVNASTVSPKVSDSVGCGWMK